MDYSRILIFLVAGLLVHLSSALSKTAEYSEPSAGEEGFEEEYSDDTDTGRDAADAASDSDAAGSDAAEAGAREGRVWGPRLISHVQAENNLSPQPHAVGNKFSQARPAPDAVPVTYQHTHYQTAGQDPVNVYPVQLPASHPVVATLDKNEGAPVSGVVTGYPVIVHIPDQNQPIAIYRGQFPAFIERIVQRIQNRYSVYNPPEYFENRPLPDIELQPPEPPLCVQAADVEGRNETQEGYAYAPPCPATTTTTTTTTEPPTTGYIYEDPKLPDNTSITVFNGTIILINCTDLHDLDTTSTTSTPYVYATPSTTTTAPPPYAYPAPAQQEELYVIPPKATSSPPPPPPSIYLPPSTNPPQYYLPPETTTTTTTTTTTAPPQTYLPPEDPKPSTPGPAYLPPETSKPSTPGPAYLPPETPKPSTPPPSYLPPESPKPPSPPPSYIPPDPAPIYLPPEHSAPSYPTPTTTTTGPVAYVIQSGKGPVPYSAPHVNININGYQQANQLQPVLPFPLRLIQFKKMFLAKILHLN